MQTMEQHLWRIHGKVFAPTNYTLPEPVLGGNCDGPVDVTLYVYAADAADNVRIAAKTATFTLDAYPPRIGSSR